MLCMMFQRTCVWDPQYGTPSTQSPVCSGTPGCIIVDATSVQDSNRETQEVYVLATPGRRDASICDSEGSARELGGLTQEPESQSQPLLQREPTTAAQPARPEPRPSTSKHSEHECKHSGSKDVRPSPSSTNRGHPKRKSIKRARCITRAMVTRIKKQTGRS